MNRLFLKSILLPSTLLALTLVGCSKKPQLSANIGFIDASTLPSVGTVNLAPARSEILQETAVALGAKGALAWQASHINRLLQREKNKLDTIFDFRQVMLKHNVIPPVIIEAQQGAHLTNSDTIRFSNKVYKLIKPAHFVTSPPTWRNYLLLSFKKPALPSTKLLPKTKAEAIVWNDALKHGWKKGLIQANSIFKLNMNYLKRNFSGMLLFKRLLMQKMVNAPVIAKANLGITGNSKEIHINDVVMRITHHSSLQMDSSKWEPFLTR